MKDVHKGPSTPIEKLICSYGSKGVKVNLCPLLTNIMTTYVPRGPRTPKNIFDLFFVRNNSQPR